MYACYFAFEICWWCEFCLIYCKWSRINLIFVLFWNNSPICENTFPLMLFVFKFKYLKQYSIIKKAEFSKRSLVFLFLTWGALYFDEREYFLLFPVHYYPNGWIQDWVSQDFDCNQLYERFLFLQHQSNNSFRNSNYKQEMNITLTKISYQSKEWWISINLLRLCAIWRIWERWTADEYPKKLSERSKWTIFWFFSNTRAIFSKTLPSSSLWARSRKRRVFGKEVMNFSNVFATLRSSTPFPTLVLASSKYTNERFSEKLCQSAAETFSKLMAFPERSKKIKVEFVFKEERTSGTASASSPAWEKKNI